LVIAESPPIPTSQIRQGCVDVMRAAGVRTRLAETNKIALCGFPGT
jgi:hypothetical protein